MGNGRFDPTQAAADARRLALAQGGDLVRAAATPAAAVAAQVSGKAGRRPSPDGEVMQKHPELGQSADRSDGSVRLAFILYYDDLEVVNPLGAFHGTHKLGMFYWALVNTAAEQRMAFHN